MGVALFFIVDSRRVLLPAPAMQTGLRHTAQITIFGAILTQGSDVIFGNLLATGVSYSGVSYK